ncbi:MYXO-CTERM sorting domain-containing protein [Nannocystis bainbridge]|uniref:MYXO-CTERM domain-containing protein n=1 Tax=Nannocystis bainbridge TaxID=2995303 RepID=A0ABT5E350_9BACT|nr:MYXO-CTERM sorting domain-containing protein [Nannocystis bainbridge]MDC0720289.1 hypothetical protein [Nannocystis bainbridge]MDC0723766.1 hypothetical protein [Nannocystis bainbridge]MDC0723768.1 hypothetical protein [Nannocystis bainbridge]
MSIRCFRAALVAIAFAFTPALARADVPPDPNSPNAHCTLAEQCPAGEFCDYAFMPGQPEAEWKHVGEECRASVAAKGLQQRCRDGGNYSGRELYCPPGATGSWSPDGKTATSAPAPAPAPVSGKSEPAKTATEAPKPATSSCAIDEAGLGAGWLVLGFALLRRRRR